MRAVAQLWERMHCIEPIMCKKFKNVFTSRKWINCLNIWKRRIVLLFIWSNHRKFAYSWCIFDPNTKWKLQFKEMIPKSWTPCLASIHRFSHLNFIVPLLERKRFFRNPYNSIRICWKALSQSSKMTGEKQILFYHSKVSQKKLILKYEFRFIEVKQAIGLSNWFTFLYYRNIDKR